MKIIGFSGYKTDILVRTDISPEEKQRLIREIMGVFSRRMGIPVEEVLKMDDETLSRRFYMSIERGLRESVACLTALGVDFPENRIAS